MFETLDRLFKIEYSSVTSMYYLNALVTRLEAIKIMSDKKSPKHSRHERLVSILSHSILRLRRSSLLFSFNSADRFC